MTSGLLVLNLLVRMSEELSGASVADCVVQADDDASGTFSPFDDLHDQVDLSAVTRVIGPDGMPETVVDDSSGDIPVLSQETMVCTGDFRQFVWRDELGRILLRFTPDEVQRMPNGRWYCMRPATLRLVREKMLSEIREAAVRRQGLLRVTYRVLGHAVGVFLRAGQLALEVEPIRPPCINYLRQLSQFEYNPKNKRMHRLCAARRSTDGAMMGIDDFGIWACAAREPRDLESEQMLDEFDARKVAEGVQRTYHSIFDPSGIDQVNELLREQESIFSGDQS